ncbi:hypothetical protein QBZ16_001812 [Prototheca wickerhamii]|uniref:Uncharacterized protein n=1 Tax=Prototheca wickerhamii TaxID=3111 RepID=A0AAD9IE14_PROWI|nr:hypothetical protein QBZ16_001812 [Prototheca wickerhamii]
MNHAGGPGRPLLGDAGYRRLIRLKHSFAGLGVVLLDYLATRADGFVDETTVCEDVRLSQKQVRRTLKFLEDAGLVRSEAVRYSRIVSVGDDPEVAPRRRAETHAFWAADYPRLKDALRLKLARMREALRRAAEETDSLQRYVCPRCGATYSSAAASWAWARATTGAARRAARARALLQRLETQLAPLTEQLERLKEADPPDPGSLQDWFLAQREAAHRRKASLEAARKRGAREGTGGADGGGADLSVDQLLDIVDAATVEVKIAGAGSPSAESEQVTGPAAERKELPAWFRLEGEAQAGDDDPAARAAREQDAAAEAERRRQLEAAYVAQYMEAVQRAAAAQGAPAGKRAGVAAAQGDTPDSKRVKLERPGAAAADTALDVQAKPEGADLGAPKDDDAAAEQETSDAFQSADFEWEDM